MESEQLTDKSLDEVAEAFRRTNDADRRLAGVFRRTFDQLYDGQRTGRYSWDQLFKTEKTHYGTLVEINLRREFDDLIDDGETLDYRIAGHEIDCKYSFRVGGWMLPPECFGELLLVATASDESSEWSLGIVRARSEFLRSGVNRDGKSGLNDAGRAAINWLYWGQPLAPNVLLAADPETRSRIMNPRLSGQARVNELFRSIQRQRIGRNTVATVAQQDDYMKRVRANGGARTALAAEGIVIIGGDYASHRRVAGELNLPVPEPGEFVSARLVRANPDDPFVAVIGDSTWRVALEDEPLAPAPRLPEIRR